jgi:RimJ/RimL family protein N-acetyltransferase
VVGIPGGGQSDRCKRSARSIYRGGVLGTSDSAKGLRVYLEAFWADHCDTVVHWSPQPDLQQESDRIARKNENGGIVLVAEREAMIVGTIEGGVPKADELCHACEFGMVVLPQFRMQGIGRQLLRHLLSWVEENDLGILKLDTFSINKPALRLYSSLGFIEDGRIWNGVKLRNGAFCDLVHMSKHIKDLS